MKQQDSRCRGVSGNRLGGRRASSRILAFNLGDQTEAKEVGMIFFAPIFCLTSDDALQRSNRSKGSYREYRLALLRSHLLLNFR
jgi:hypothetical protein